MTRSQTWGLFVGTGLLSLAILIGIDCYRRGMFFPSQIAERFGVGIPLSVHGGWISDIVILPLMLGVTVAMFSYEWRTGQVLVMLGIGFALALANHLGLIFGQDIPDPLGWKGEKWSWSVAFHFVYFTVATAVIGLFFFCSRPSDLFIIAFTLFLGIHVLMGVHMFLGAVNAHYEWSWCPKFFENNAIWFVSGGTWLVIILFASITFFRR